MNVMEKVKDLFKEVEEGLEARKNGIKHTWWDYKLQKDVDHYISPDRGKGSKAYLTRRIKLIREYLLELEKDIMLGKYDKKK
jgi:hypothetical protein